MFARASLGSSDDSCLDNLNVTDGEDISSNILGNSQTTFYQTFLNRVNMPLDIQSHTESLGDPKCNVLIDLDNQETSTTANDVHKLLRVVSGGIEKHV